MRWTGIGKGGWEISRLPFEAEGQSLEAENLMEAVYNGLTGMETAFKLFQKWASSD